MSESVRWRAWSCDVRVTLPDGTAADAALAAQTVQQLMLDVELSASRFRSGSEIERVNAAAGRLVPVTPLTLRLVAVALDAARQTHGAVDPTVGGHVLGAGYTEDIAQVRGAHRPVSANPRPPADWQAVRLDRVLGRVGVPAGLRLDLGATAKAWTADEAARRVHARLQQPALVEIGGDLAVAGEVAAPWRIDVAEIAGLAPQRVDLTHGGLATSSTVARAWTSRRGVEHHVIDPMSSRPTTGPVRTATVWAATCVAANTLSTAALVWGAGAEDRLLGYGADARLVLHSGAVRTVGAWPAHEDVAA